MQIMKIRTLIEMIKNLGLVSKLRSKKWKKRAQSELLSTYEINKLEAHPEKINDALIKHMQKLSKETEDISVEVNRIIQHSVLSKMQIDIAAVKQDMIFWHFAYGYTFNEYVCYKFYCKTKKQRRAFLSDRDIACLCYDLNDLRYMRLLNDKAETYRIFKEYYKREAVVISSESDMRAFLNFVNEHSIFVKKLVNEACGRSVELIDLTKTAISPSKLFFQLLSRGKTIIEELVVQSDTLKELNETSVNTLRCITLGDKKQIIAPFFFMKAGRKGSFVDNGAAGGLLIAVNSETGVLGSAIDEFGNEYIVHPDSGTKIEGFQLPEWKQVKAMSCELSARLPECKMIGWDLAHTEKGWVLIEGNSMTEAIGPQSTQQTGIRKEIESFYKRYNRVFIK